MSQELRSGPEWLNHCEGAIDAQRIREIQAEALRFAGVFCESLSDLAKRAAAEASIRHMGEEGWEQIEKAIVVHGSTYIDVLKKSLNAMADQVLQGVNE